MNKKPKNKAKKQSDDKEQPATQKEQFTIPIDSIFEDFKKHIDIPENNRILFSGKFGTGKTYFLKKFFEKHQKEYFLVHLHPSRYQIASNEKIIDYIKMDILLSVLEKIEQNSKSSSPATYKKIVDSKWGSIALSIGKSVPIAGSYFKAIGEILKIAGTVTEESIKNKLEKEERKKVLIIDDLDRLDPEHIFRICNVFSALVGEDEEDEEGTAAKKLGFDTVIFVADYKNLKSIFHHKHGLQTDAQGYFDKLYSIEIFEHSPKESIHKWIQSTFQDIIGESKKNNGDSEVFLMVNKWLTIFLLGNFLRVDRLNLRQILTGLKYKTSSMQRYYNPQSMPFLHPDIGKKMLIKNTISFLIETVGSKEELIEAIEKSLTEDTALYIFESQSDNQTMRALKECTKIMCKMIEDSNQREALSNNGITEETFTKKEGDASSNNIPINKEDILNAFRKLLILYIKEAHNQANSIQMALIP